NASIGQNQSGFPKTLVSAREKGLRPIALPAGDAYEEADALCQLILEGREEGIPLSKQAVLYRNHYDSIVLQGELVSRKIPYTVRGGLRFCEQAHIQGVLAYLRVQVNPRDESAWRRLLMLLPGIGPAKATAVFERIGKGGDPLALLASKEVMNVIPAKARG